MRRSRAVFAVGSGASLPSCSDGKGPNPGPSLDGTAGGNFPAVGDINGIPFPLVPDSIEGAYSHSGELKAGSGRYVRVVQQPGAGAVDLKLTGPTGSALPSSIDPRIALVRIR